MHPEAEEMVFLAYLQLCDSACAELRELEKQKQISLDDAIALMGQKAGFLLELPHEQSISALTKKNQQQCGVVLDAVIEKLGIRKYQSFTQLIRRRMGKVFGLKPE